MEVGEGEDSTIEFDGGKEFLSSGMEGPRVLMDSLYDDGRGRRRRMKARAVEVFTIEVRGREGLEGETGGRGEKRRGGRLGYHRERH